MSDVDLATIAGSRLLEDGANVFAGIGAPFEAAALAKRLHAPNLTVAIEGGSIDPKLLPGRLPRSTNEMRAAYGATMITGIVDLFWHAQRGCFDYGFIGAAQIDRFGNVNTSVIGDPRRPAVRLPGGGGANDIVSNCRRVIVITRHEPRRFVERVDFVTSPGYLDGGAGVRERAGLDRGRPLAVITDLALLGYDHESGRMRLDALQPGVEVDDVVASTAFELLVAEPVRRLEPPSDIEIDQLTLLRGGDREASTR